MIAGTIFASRPQGDVVYPGYAQPVYGPGCYWASQLLLHFHQDDADLPLRLSRYGEHRPSSTRRRYEGRSELA